MARSRSPQPPLPTTLPSFEIAASRLAESTPGLANVSFVSRDDASNDQFSTGTFTLSSTVGDIGRIPESDTGTRWFVGVDEGEPHHFRTAGAALVRAAACSDSESTVRASKSAQTNTTLQIELGQQVDSATFAELLLGLLLGGYRYRVSNTRDKVSRTVGVRFVVSPDQLTNFTEIAQHAEIMARATALTRDLANTPSNVKTPAWLAETAEQILSSSNSVRVTIRDEEWLERKGFGGVLAVSGGSIAPSRLIEMKYRPTIPQQAGSQQKTQHLLLVGKGITFDTGGLSIKPAAGMHLMRTDMAGGAAVIAAVRAIAELNLPVRVTALVPAAENHVSGSAYRPGDIVRHYGGKTTEVHNTDAEGRMVLADALVYGIEKYSPDLVVDVATLTGGMKVALGLRTGGFFANRDDIAAQIVKAGELSAESWWRLPLLDWLHEHVTAGAADVCQTPKGPPGITAALFLQEFVGDTPWAHLDIAGPARADKNYAEVVAGATGFSARTLVELVAAHG